MKKKIKGYAYLTPDRDDIEWIWNEEAGADQLLVFKTKSKDKETNLMMVPFTLEIELKEKEFDEEEVTTCPKCFCMTHTLRDNICGKCKREKK